MLNKSKMMDLLTALADYAFYSDYLRDSCINLDSVGPLFDKLPIMTKKTLQKEGDRIRNLTFDDSIVVEMTTGTTGVPLKCPKNRRERNQLALTLWNHRKKIDKSFDPTSFLLLYGSTARKIGNFFNFDIDNLNKCFEYINLTKPRWLVGSPSSMYIYAKEIAEGNLKYDNKNLRVIELQGEYVDRTVREYIEEIFQAKTVVHYGLRECWTIGYECAHGAMHIVDDVHVSQEQGNLYVTSYVMRTMPIVKYMTGDSGLVQHQSCPCGNDHILTIQDGRVTALIKGTKINGNIFFKGILNEVIKKNENIISQFQVEQISETKFVIYICTGKEFRFSVVTDIINKMKDKLGWFISVEIKYDTIKTTQNGKHSIFIPIEQ